MLDFLVEDRRHEIKKWARIELSMISSCEKFNGVFIWQAANHSQIRVLSKLRRRNMGINQRSQFSVEEYRENK